MTDIFDEERIARIARNIKKLDEIQHKIIEECKSEDEIITTLHTLINKRKQEPECIKKTNKTRI